MSAAPPLLPWAAVFPLVVDGGADDFPLALIVGHDVAGGGAGGGKTRCSSARGLCSRSIGYAGTGGKLTVKHATSLDPPCIHADRHLHGIPEEHPDPDGTGGYAALRYLNHRPA
jgi:hypothetical protein